MAGCVTKIKVEDIDYEDLYKNDKDFRNYVNRVLNSHANEGKTLKDVLNLRLTQEYGLCVVTGNIKHSSTGVYNMYSNSEL